MNRERRNRIAEMVADKKAVTNADIMKRFGVSIETVRRDLAYLESKGLIERVYGGAVERRFLREEPSYGRREKEHETQKRAIAAAALEFLHDGDAVFFDIGTTVELIARSIKEPVHLSAFTNSLRTAIVLSQKGFPVTLPGGNLRSGEFAVSGTLAENNMEVFNVDTAFIGVGGATEDGITDFIPDEAHFRSRIIEQASHVIAVTDSSKCGIRALCKVCPWSKVDVLITDAATPVSIQKAAVKAGTRLVMI